MKHYSLIFLLLIFLTACSEEEVCRESTTSMLYAAFLNAGTTTAYSVDTLTISGLAKDSLIYNKKRKISAVSLPLNQQENNSTFIFKFNSIRDTVMILHSNNESFISFACGCMITHTLDTVLTTNHFIQSVKIINYDINAYNVRHLQIYH